MMMHLKSTNQKSGNMVQQIKIGRTNRSESKTKAREATADLVDLEEVLDAADAEEEATIVAKVVVEAILLEEEEMEEVEFILEGMILFIEP